MEYSVKEGKFASIIAYLTFVGTIIAYFINNDTKNKFASFHIRQALGIHLTFYMLGLIISLFDSWAISSAFYLFFIILWGYGIVGAIQGELNEVPILGKQFQKWFNPIS